MAIRFESKLTLFHVSAMPAYYYAAYGEGMTFPLDEIEARTKTMLDAAVAKAKPRYPGIESLMAVGYPWEEILTAAKNLRADLIVMGTHGRRGVARVFLGSVAEKIVRHSLVPVLTTAGAPIST
jgi:nucleotide-binding universal stress UspA family protein